MCDLNNNLFLPLFANYFSITRKYPIWVLPPLFGFQGIGNSLQTTKPRLVSETPTKIRFLETMFNTNTRHTPIWFLDPDSSFFFLFSIRAFFCYYCYFFILRILNWFMAPLFIEPGFCVLHILISRFLGEFPFSVFTIYCIFNGDVLFNLIR